jgi:predicted HTH transcriptional regulator
MSDRNIRRILANLVDTELLERKGSQKQGQWVVIEKN